MSDKRKLEVSGEVDAWGGGLTDTGPRVGGRDLIGEMQSVWPEMDGASGSVKVWLGVEPVATGAPWANHGFGGTDVTPADPPEICVGGVDLLKRLRDLDGREVLVIVEDA